jgi:hypothetical protein
MRDVLAEVVDDRCVFEMAPEFARNIISAFARLGGDTVRPLLLRFAVAAVAHLPPAVATVDSRSCVAAAGAPAGVAAICC